MELFSSPQASRLTPQASVRAGIVSPLIRFVRGHEILAQQSIDVRGRRRPTVAPVIRGIGLETLAQREEFVLAYDELEYYYLQS